MTDECPSGAHLLQYSPPWGIAILAAMYLLFTYLTKEPLEQWLFHDEE